MKLMSRHGLFFILFTSVSLIFLTSCDKKKNSKTENDSLIQQDIQDQVLSDSTAIGDYNAVNFSREKATDKCTQSQSQIEERERMIEQKSKERGYPSFEQELKDHLGTLGRLPVRNLSEDAKVSEYLKKHKVYVSLTTSPTRLKTVNHVFDTLDLSHVDEILLNLPERFGRDNCPYVIPEDLVGSYGGKVKVLRIPIDLGPITKLLPAIEYAQSKGDKNAIVITIDDDTAYPKGMIPEIIYQIVKNKKTAVSGSGQNVYFWTKHHEPPLSPSLQNFFPGKDLPGHLKNSACGWSTHPEQDASSHCDVIEGFGAIGYRAGFVDVELMKKLRFVDNLRKQENGKFPKDCFASDDMVISFALAISGVNRLKVDNKFHRTNLIKQFSFGYLPDALHAGAGIDLSPEEHDKDLANKNAIKYNKCLDRLMEVTFDSSLGKFRDVETIKSDKRLAEAPQEPKFTVGPEEKKFIEKVTEMVVSNDVKACYSLESPLYFLVHLLPLYHVVQGQFCGVAQSEKAMELKKRLLERDYPREAFKFVKDPSEFLKYLEKSTKNIMLADTGLGYDWENHSNIFYFSHGVDEDAAYINETTLDPKRPQAKGTLLFSRFNEVTQPSLEQIRDYYRIDKDKKTIFYAGTIGQWEFTDATAPKEVREETIKQLIGLKENYNVIIRPHPLQSKEFLEELRKNFIIAPFQEFPSFVPFYDIADIVIGTPSAATTTATHRPELPIILLRPRITWEGKTNMDEMAKKNEGIVLGDKTVTVINDKQILEKDSLKNAVEAALKVTPENTEKIAQRRAYFTYWFGCVDGYDEYRAWMRTFGKIGIDVSELKAIYQTFPKYRDRPLCQL